MLDTVLQAGQVNIIACDIIQANGAAINVTPQIEKISFYEDIFSSFSTGCLTLRDTLDIPAALGRQGRDLLRLTLGTPSLSIQNQITGYFHIYKMGERTLASDRSQLYNFYFASEEILADTHRRISKTYKGSPESLVSEIIKSKLGSTKKINTDSATNQIHYTSNYWTPTKNLRYIIENSTSSDSSTFLFYENRDGFNFKTLSSIARQTDYLQAFVASDFIADINDDPSDKLRFGSATRNPNRDYGVIREMRVDKNFDYLDFFEKGGVRTRMVTHDILTKKYNVQNFDFIQDNHPLLNPNKVLKDDVIMAAEPLVFFAPKYYNLFDDGDVGNTKFVQKRLSQIAQYQYHKIEIDVFGRTDYTCGKKVRVDVNQSRPLTKDETAAQYLDKNYSGDYIVSAVAHHITRKEHMATFELIKDSTLAK